jgi:hypothetical protein
MALRGLLMVPAGLLLALWIWRGGWWDIPFFLALFGGMYLGWRVEQK